MEGEEQFSTRQRTNEFSGACEICLPVSVCDLVPLSVFLCVFLSAVYLCLSVSLSPLCLSAPPPNPPPPLPRLTLCVSLSLSVSLCLCLCLSLSLLYIFSLCVSVSLSLSVSVSLSLSLCLSVSLPPHSLSLPLCLSLCQVYFFMRYHPIKMNFSYICCIILDPIIHRLLSVGDLSLFLTQQNL